MSTSDHVNDIEIDKVLPSSGEFTWRERAVLKNSTIRRNYNDLIDKGKLKEAKSYLSYEVNILEIHEKNSKSPIPGASEEKLPVDPLLPKSGIGISNNVVDEPDSVKKIMESVRASTQILVGSGGEPRRWVQLIKCDHVALLTKIFSLNVLLCSADIITDIAVSTEFFARDDFYWGLWTTLIIMAPIKAQMLLQLCRAVNSFYRRNFTLAKFQLKSLPLIIGQQHPISNLRYFIGLLLMDASLPQNSALVARIDKLVLVSGFFQTFLQSAPQLILQCSIILRTGYITPFQTVAIPTSFLMVVLFSTRLYFYQRLERFRDLNPPLKMIFFVFPFITIQNIGFLISLVFIATYIRGYVMLCIAFTIFLNFIMLSSYFKWKQIPIDKSVFVQKDSDPTYNQSVDEAEDEKWNMFWTGILTSWVSPCTVWVNNLKSKSYFLLVSSLTTYFAHMIGIFAVYLRLHYGRKFDMNNGTITHCFTDKNLFFKPGIELVYDFLLKFQTTENNSTRVRICGNEENPSDLFTHTIGPAIIGLLFLSFLSSILLFILSNYLSMYKLSKKIFTNFPIIHTSLIHDYLRNFSKLSQTLRGELPEVFSFAITFEKKVLLQQDRFGETALHIALSNNLYEQLYQMLCAGGDPNIKDHSGVSVRELVESEYYSIKDSNATKTMAKIRATLDKKDVTSYLSVWKDLNPMHEAVTKDDLTRMTCFQMIGGQVGAMDREEKSSYSLLLEKIEEEKVILSKSNFFVKHWILKGPDEYGQTILHQAAKAALHRSVQELIANKADINAAAREDGSTPLHFAAMSGSFDCVRILIENKADVNKPSFALYTPLHDAAGVGAVECVKLLIENGAKVNAKNKNGSTPLHLAALWGQAECVKLLIDGGAEVDEVNKEFNTPLHEASWEIANQLHMKKEKEKCCRLLIDNGARFDITNKNGKTATDYQNLSVLREREPELFIEIV